MNDATAAEYLGKTPSSYSSWVTRNGITRVRHGRWAISPKDEIDRASGALPQTGE